MKILSIETSCDETSAAVIEGNRGKVKILSNVISSQIDIHKKYGGVVPEVAARNHILNIMPVIDEALRGANNTPLPLSRGEKLNSFPSKRGDRGVFKVDLIAVTGGPGLMSSLLIGAQSAEILAYVWKKPLIVVNHIESHIYANWLTPISVNSKLKSQDSKKLRFPVLSLVVSGGHTELVLMRDHLKYKTVGETRDDAAGEAFDKVAKILGLGYPGGPIVSKMADLKPPLSPFLKGWKGGFKLPRPMIKNNDFDFSFSGLKTAVLYLVRKLEKEKSLNESIIAGICAEFQQAVIDVLVHKTIATAKKYKVKSVLLAGGVAANKELRRQIEEAVKRELGEKIVFNVPEQILCTDNAAMVGATAYYRYMAKSSVIKVPPARIKIDPNWQL
ncbi:MAG: tRNA (adenosine(37)-N6)-threonylcarbamoyltransferase complex transferase subunit TsaD [bacterium]